MTYLLRKASDYNFEKEIDIDTLEELRYLWNEETNSLYHHEFVVNFARMEIMIYDDYLE
jgi:hypothetical protein